MRKELYLAAAHELLSMTDENDEQLVKYVNMWNQNVDFIDEEEPWERPAVFLEILPIAWERTKTAGLLHANAQLKLHIVTDYKGDYGATDVDNIPTDSLEQFDLPEKIAKRMIGLRGEGFCNMCLVESTTNHNHEEIVEVVDTYKFTCDTWVE